MVAARSLDSLWKELKPAAKSARRSGCRGTPAWRVSGGAPVSTLVVRRPFFEKCCCVVRSPMRLPGREQPAASLKLLLSERVRQGAGIPIGIASIQYIRVQFSGFWRQLSSRRRSSSVRFDTDASRSGSAHVKVPATGRSGRQTSAISGILRPAH